MPQRTAGISYVSLSADSRLHIGGLSVYSAFTGEGAIGIFTFSNVGLFGHSDSFGCVVIHTNAEGVPIVVAVGARWPAASVIDGEYHTINPGHSLYLPAGQYIGLAMVTTPIPAEYTGKSLAFVVAEYDAASQATIGGVAPFVPSAWLTASFKTQSVFTSGGGSIYPAGGGSSSSTSGGSSTSSSSSSSSSSSVYPATSGGSTSSASSGGSGATSSTSSSGGGTLSSSGLPSQPTVTAPTSFLGFSPKAALVGGAILGAVVIGGVVVVATGRRQQGAG
jgi:hypothetical protein